MTRYLRPASIDEACKARRDHPSFVVVSGGTDVMVRCEERPEPVGIVDVFRLRGIVGIEERADHVWIGASTTYSELIASPIIAHRMPILVEASREVGAVQIQNRGTIGGNVGTSSPVGDTLPLLLALDARIALASPNGARTVPYAEYCVGYRKTVLRADELITGIEIPFPAADAVQYYRKIGTRRAQAISKALVAVVARVANDHFIEAKIALGAMADRPIRVEPLEALLEGRRRDATLAAEATTLLTTLLTPITDIRSTAPYRTAVVTNLLTRFVGGGQAQA